jgi:hypothetical protein
MGPGRPSVSKSTRGVGKDAANKGLALDDRKSATVPVPVEFVLSGQLFGLGYFLASKLHQRLRYSYSSVGWGWEWKEGSG